MWQNPFQLMKRLLLLIAIATPLLGAESTTRMTLRQHVLRLINNDRQVYNLPPVALDPAASAIADDYCRQQIREGTMGHFGTNGFAPYMRYSWAGGEDGVSENAAAWSANYTFSDRALYEMVRRSEDSMMGEVPPKDGHKRTILDPYATHVGIGLAWEKGEFRMVHEFIRRYIDWNRPLPRLARLTDEISGRGKPKAGLRVEAISVHHEPLPHALTVKAANSINVYGLPGKRRDYLPRRGGPLTVASNGAFTFSVPFSDGPGVYTVVVWVRKEGEERTIAASNVSIRVDGSAFSGTR
jgi:hypothetical protein